MILASDTNISNVLSVFSSLGLKATFLVPTDTAMKKSIIDATNPVREYLSKTSAHEYSYQELGPENKVLKETFFVGDDELIKTQTSLYRPLTKNGDPRIWFYRLNTYASAFNLLAIIAKQGKIYVINCSNKEVLKSLEDGSNPLFKALNISNDGLTLEAYELLGLLQGVGALGWVPSMRVGDTGVGFTLESLIGIPANSSKAPDYKGIEIKSARKKSSIQTLFSKTPNWGKSRLKGTLQILEERGQFSAKHNRDQIFHSIFADKQNSYGLQLEVDHEENLLKQYCNIAGRREDDVLWEISVLQNALKKKHKQTFWVKAETRRMNGSEEFLYFEGAFTREPNVEALPLLLEAGHVFVDYTIKRLPNGSHKDQGYPFRMRKTNLEFLFGKPKIFDLV